MTSISLSLALITYVTKFQGTFISQNMTLSVMTNRAEAINLRHR